MSRFIFIVFFLIPSPVLAQNNGHPLITHYPNKNFSGSNWDVVQDSRGLLYIANYDGILEYDGVTWRLIKTKTAPISLSINSNNQIFVGAAHGFGILQPNSSGSLIYHALSDSVSPEVPISSIFHVQSDANFTYFYTHNRIFTWDGSNVNTINSTNSPFISNILKYKDDLYVFNKDQTLFQLHQDSSIEIGSIPFNLQKAVFLDSMDNDLVIASRSKGLIRINKNNYSNPFPEVDSFLFSSSVYSGEKINLPNYSYALSTQNKGVVLLSDDFKIKNILNKDNGLKTNVVKGLTIDKGNNLWIALQEGVAQLEFNSPFNFISEDYGYHGEISDVVATDKGLYLATTEGLFVKKHFNFQKVEAITGRVWALSNFKDKSNRLLFSSLPNGVFELSDNSIKKINDLHASMIHKLKGDKNQWIIGHNNGIDLLIYKDGNYSTKSIIKSSGETFYKILEDGNGNIWASSKFNGVYKIGGDLSSGPEISLYTTDHGLPDVNEISFAIIHKQFFLATTKGMYSFNSQVQKFEPHILSEYNIKYIEPVFGKPNSFYLITKDDQNREQLHHIEFTSIDTYILNSTPFKRLQEIQYFDLHSISDSILWIGTSEGLYRYNSNVKKDYYLPFQTLIRNVQIGDSVIFNGAYYDLQGSDKFSKIIKEQPKAWIPHIPYDSDIKFQFSASFYELSEKNMYSYYLKGEDKKWSSWIYETKKEYNNLSAGEYTFLVKSKNIYDREGKIDTYSFVVLPPWYQTVWAYILFIFIGAFFIWLLMILYTMRIRQQRRKLKLLVADRTYEVLAQKKAIEEQNTQLLKQNDKILLQKNAIEDKNEELEKSKEEILSINEKLQELNNSLEKKVEKRTEKIKTTLKKLQLTNKELDTFIYRASHDLKGPISRIYGLTSLAKLESPKTESHKYLELIEKVTYDMQGLLSKLTEVHEVLNRNVTHEELDILAILGDIKRTTLQIATNHNISFSFDMESGFILYSDELLIKIILENLIENAFIYRKGANYPHEVKVKAATTKDSLLIEVSDNGIGINPDLMPKVFDMFYRGTEQSKGSGLGLYLVKISVEKLGGEVSVKSVAGESTSFNVTLPKGLIK